MNPTLLENIVQSVTTLALTLCSMIYSFGPFCQVVYTYSHLVQIKIVVILTILCRLAYWNNTSYISLTISLYLYSAGACIDAITLLNHLRLSVSYDTLQKKLWKFFHADKQWIKSQQNNKKLVGTWDNFEFRENLTSERVGNRVKFYSITIAVFIVKGWRISEQGLKQ